MSQALEKILSLLAPKSTQLQKIRLGEVYDGGYVVSEAHCKSAEGLITFGVGDSFKFEEDFYCLNPKAGIFLFDHSVDQPASLPDAFQFEKVGLGQEPNCRPLSYFVDSIVQP